METKKKIAQLERRLREQDQLMKGYEVGKEKLNADLKQAQDELSMRENRASGTIKNAESNPNKEKETGSSTSNNKGWPPKKMINVSSTGYGKTWQPQILNGVSKKN